MQNPNNPAANSILSIRTLVENGRGEFAMARRAPGFERAGMWEFPGGKVDPGEMPLDAALRELVEEVGVIAHPRTGLEEIENRCILEGKHAGEIYTALGCVARAREPFDVLRTSDETDAVGWFTPEEIANMSNVTPTSQEAAR